MGLLLALQTAMQHDPAEDGFCRWIIISLASAVVSLACFIAKQFADRIKDLKETKDLSNTLLDVVRKDRGTR